MDRNEASAQPVTVYRRDYQPSPFLIDSIELLFELHPTHTKVTNVMHLNRNRLYQGEYDAMRLNGENLELIKIEIDGSELAQEKYSIDAAGLTILHPSTECTMRIETEINPDSNKALSGLYRSSGNYCTQCEAEGFRRITYYFDRPDVLARFTTRIEADYEECPVLLANGNLKEAGKLSSGKHYAIWEDPFPKPSYLFALVAGKLTEISDQFTTKSGKEVALKIYVEPQNKDKCAHAMSSLKRAMLWDEQIFGLEYDLDTYMIVAVDDFNMGAMENKGLNIFNSKYVLASPETATDQDYMGIESVIGHEYFHNWTGNRVTCRDWFQLSLKEGLTVFRDQEFSADLHSRPVKRIEDVKILRNSQFREDAGPMAHPVRPESYVEINNFYTLTVYNKGAEVVRMLHRIIGGQAFLRGMELYFQRYDGMAVTCDDFVDAMADAADVNLDQFKLWYSQAGTPLLEVKEKWDSPKGRLTLTIQQWCSPTPGQEQKEPFHLPILIGFLPAELNQDSELEREEESHLIELKKKIDTFIFSGFKEKPKLSFLREFSAPVKVKPFQSDEELAFLMAHDTDDFNRWEAAFRLSISTILSVMESLSQSRQPKIKESYIEAFAKILTISGDNALTALALTLPSDSDLCQNVEVIDPEIIHRAILFVRQEIATRLYPDFIRVYQKCLEKESSSFHRDDIARRRLKNCCLTFLLTPGHEQKGGIDIALAQYKSDTNMTNSVAALAALAHLDSPDVKVVFDDFYKRWRNVPLVVDKWLTLQATSSNSSALTRVKELMEHPAFSIENPNKVRSLIGAFCSMNHHRFHDESGAGYRFLTEQVIKLNKLNPQIAARLLTPLVFYASYITKCKVLMEEQLRFLAQKKNLSPDVYEIVQKCLKNDAI